MCFSLGVCVTSCWWPLWLRTELRHLYLDGNCVIVLSDVLNLSPLKHVSVLKLFGNPIATTNGYRDTVCAVLPSLRVMDGVAVDRGQDGALGMSLTSSYVVHCMTLTV